MTQNTYTLDEIKQDLHRILNSQSVTRDEVLFLLAQIYMGNVEGSCYVNSRVGCGCLVGTIAIYRGLEHRDIEGNAMGFDVFPAYPIERYFYDVVLGETPETSHKLRQVATWIEEWLDVAVPS